MYSVAQFIPFRELHRFPRIPLLKMEDPGKGDEQLEAGLMRQLDPTKVGSLHCALQFDAGAKEAGSRLGQALHQGHSRSSRSMSGCPMCFTSSTGLRIGIEPISQYQAAVSHPVLDTVVGYPVLDAVVGHPVLDATIGYPVLDAAVGP